MANNSISRKRVKPEKILAQFNSDETPFNWRILILVIICCAITGLVVRFFVDVHYSNQLLQVSGQATSAQSSLGAQQYDFQFLLKHDNNQINCYELHSQYDRTVCFTHNNQ